MILLILGLALLALVLRDVFQTVVVPRGKASNFRIAPVLVRNVFWPSFRYAASRTKSPVWKVELLGLFAPFVLMMLLTVWIGLLICAFGLISFALSREYSPALDSLSTAIYVSGSSVLTLGSAEYVNKSAKVRFLMLAAAFTGMVVTASVVSLFFALIGSIHRREVLVSVTTNVAGSPPSGIAILETYCSVNGRKSLSSFYQDWHCWCADVFETHKAYPILPYFRSNDPLTSWLTALGATLDSASLLLSVDRDVDCFAAQLTYHFGCRLVNELAQNWHLVKTQLPELDHDQFHNLYVRLQAAGYCVDREDTARENFALLRREYLPALRALCEYIAVPPTPMASDYRLRLPTLANSA